MGETALTAGAEWRRHWTLVAAALVGFSFVSMMVPAASVFMKPMIAEFGWTRAQFFSGTSLAALFGIVLASVVGMAIDRWGTRRLALPGIVALACSIAAFSLTNGAYSQWIMLWLIFGACSLFLQSNVWSTAVAGVFNPGRGLALGVTMSGTAVAQVVAYPLTNWLVQTQGWRAAFIWLGFGWGGLALLLSLFFLYDAHNIRINAQKGINARQNKETARAVRSGLSGLTIRQAWRSSALWRIGVATFLILVITIAVSSQQVPILQAIGFSDTSAAWLATLAGFAGIAGKLVTGVLIDRFHARWVGGITLASTAIAYPLMMGIVSSPVLVVIGLMISGYAAGTKIQLCAYLTARYGGIRNYGTIIGFMTSITALSAAAGPFLAGKLFDIYHSYGPFLGLGVAVSLISGALIFSLGRYPDWDVTDSAA